MKVVSSLTIGLPTYKARFIKARIVKMNSKYDGLKGKRFGRLSVISNPIAINGFRYYDCICDCGNEKRARADNLICGDIQSCGCYSRDVKANNCSQQRIVNDYSIIGNTVIVTLASTDKHMICDLEDWERLKDHCWGLDSSGYAKTNFHKNDEKLESKKFHINVIGKKDGYYVDHINRDRLDNRKCNLRHVTPRGNAINAKVGKNNTSGHVGVYKIPHSNKWRAYIYENGNNHYLGRFQTKREAIQARLDAEKKYQNIESEVLA